MPTSETISPSLTILLFGPQQVLVGDQPFPRLRSRKALWLLALLTLRPGRSVEREWIAGNLWPEVDKDQGFANLRPLLSDLRSALGDQSERLQSPSRHTVLLDLTGAEVDVLAFDAAIASQEISALTQAVALYRGPLLEGCAEEWILSERHLREQHCLQALQRLADHALVGGDYVTSITYYRRAVGLDAGCEAARRGWMEALAQKGDTNAALQVYREFVTWLKSDPSAAPDPLTSALYARLRAEVRQSVRPTVAETPKKVPTPTVSGSLPHPLTTLVGRAEERIEVAAALRRSRLVTLTGPGGIGKTRLASGVAAEIVSEYVDGVWLVALEALSDASLIASQIASVLGVKEKKECPLLQTLTEHLHSRRLLLVLDNCEHLLEANAQIVGRLLQECVGLRILATSREALGMMGEIIWMVPPLAVPDPDPLMQPHASFLRMLEGYESVQLFMERARRVQQTFALTETNAQAVARVCAHLEGIPLAIELAASRIKAMTVEELAPRLLEHLEPVSGNLRRAHSRQQTLRATVDWSHMLLSVPERTLFRRLAVFAGGWTLEAAEAICAGEGIEASEVLKLIASLVSKSLVMFVESENAEGGRYRFLEVVRQYAVEHLQASRESDPVRARHLDWFLALAEKTQPPFKQLERELWLRQLEADHANLRSALAAANADGTEISLRFAGALGQFWYLRGYYHEGRSYLSHALESDTVQRKNLPRAKALYGAGMLANGQSDYTPAHGLLEESLGIYRELGEEHGIADALNELGNAAYLQTDYARAQDLYTETLRIRRKEGMKRGIAEALSNLAKAVRPQNDYALTRNLFEESISIHRELGNRRGVATSLLNLAYLLGEQGDYMLSQSLFEECLSIVQELGDKDTMAWALNGLMHLAYEQGDYAKAHTLLLQSLNIFQEMGSERGIALTLYSLGNVTHHQGDYAKAQAYLEESLTRLQGIGDRHGVVDALRSLGDVLLTCDQAPKAVPLWAVSDKLRTSLGLPLTTHEQERHAQQLAQACSQMGNEAFAFAWEEGALLTWEQAIGYALEHEDQF